MLFLRQYNNGLSKLDITAESIYLLIVYPGMRQLEAFPVTQNHAIHTCPTMPLSTPTIRHCQLHTDVDPVSSQPPSQTTIKHYLHYNVQT